MRCQSCEDHGFHDYRFCSCCGRPVADSSALPDPAPPSRVATPVADRPVPAAPVLPARRCECCGGPWDGKGTLCAGCQRVFGRVLDAAARTSDVGAYHPPARPSSSTLTVVPPCPPALEGNAPSQADTGSPVPAVMVTAAPEAPPRPWWEYADAASATAAVAPAAPHAATWPESSRLTTVVAVPPPLLATATATPPAQGKPASAPPPAASRRASPWKAKRAGLAQRTQRLIRATLGGVALVILLLLGVPAFQASRGHHEVPPTPDITAAATNGSELVAADPATVVPAAAASLDGTPRTQPSTVAPAPPSPAPAERATAGALAGTRGSQPPSRSVRSSSKTKTPPQKTAVKNDVPAPAPAPVVVPERTVNVPAQATSTMASVTAVPTVSLGQTYEAAQVDVRPRVESQVPAVVPDHLRQRAAEGVVVLRVRVSASGHPADVQVLRKSNVDAALDAAAVAAVRKWRFSPARKRGETVNCWLNVGVPFRGGDHEGTD